MRKRSWLNAGCMAALCLLALLGVFCWNSIPRGPDWESKFYWLNPSDWAVGQVMRQGTFRGKQWEAKTTSFGILAVYSTRDF